jgi:hypothetical protein
VSVRRFEGWEPTTFYTHDDAGRLVSSRPESEWDEEQQGWLLALALARQLTCDGCGGWLPETTATDPEEYVVPPPYRCGKCTKLGIAQEAHAADHRHMHATRWSAERRSDGEPHGER